MRCVKEIFPKNFCPGMGQFLQVVSPCTLGNFCPEFSMFSIVVGCQKGTPFHGYQPSACG